MRIILALWMLVISVCSDACAEQISSIDLPDWENHRVTSEYWDKIYQHQASESARSLSKTSRFDDFTLQGLFMQEFGNLYKFYKLRIILREFGENYVDGANDTVRTVLINHGGPKRQLRSIPVNHNHDLIEPQSFYTHPRSIQKFLIAQIESGIFDHQWLRVFLEMNMDLSELEPRELLAFTDALLGNSLPTIHIPDCIPTAKDKRTRVIIYSEHLKLRLMSYGHHRTEVLDIFNRMGWINDDRIEQGQRLENLFAEVYVIERALRYAHNLRYFLDRLVTDRVKPENVHLILKHALLRHPKSVEALGVFGRELASHPATIVKPIKLPQRLLTFVANAKTQGDRQSPETMDYFGGNQYPWLSLILPAISQLGYRFEVLDWENCLIRWDSRKCLFIGPVWGYSKKSNAFHNWLKKLNRPGVRTINSMEFLTWNVNKTYLRDLQDAKIPVVPTYIEQSPDKASLGKLLTKAQKHWGMIDVIFKGVVGAGGFDYHHFDPTKPHEAKEHIETLLQKNNGVVMQPFWKEISQTGEFSLVFVGNALSHYYLKVCGQATEERVQVFYGGRSIHYTYQDAIQWYDNPVLSEIEKFRSDVKLTPKSLEDVIYMSQILWANIQHYMQNRGMCPPPVVRLDCALRNNQLYVMEIEGLDPYLEFSEASQRQQARPLVLNYANELLRQFSIYG